MAYFVRKKSAVYVYLHDPETQRNKPLPRNKTRHLDGATDLQVKGWLDNYLLTQGYERKVNETTIDPKMIELVEAFIAYLKSREKSWNTVSWYRKYLLDYILPFFVNKLGATDPNSWLYKSPQLLAYLEKDRKLSASIIVRCNVALRKFWDWLQDEGHVVIGVKLKLRNPVLKKRETPLEEIKTPEQVFRFALFCQDRDVALLALLGYFFSLRPQETMILRKRNFKGGTDAQSIEAVNVMQRWKLFNRFAVHVKAQKDQKGTEKDPKHNSKGWVACFNEAAAKLIVTHLQGKPNDELLFPKGTDHYFKKWRKKGLGITLKDLRRSSLYWLGHNTDLPPVALKNHARHKKMSTTDDYLRRPEDKTTESSELSLDLV